MGPGRGKGASGKATEVFKSWVYLMVSSVCPPHHPQRAPGLVEPEGTLRNFLSGGEGWVEVQFWFSVFYISCTLLLLTVDIPFARLSFTPGVSGWGRGGAVNKNIFFCLFCFVLEIRS